MSSSDSDEGGFYSNVVKNLGNIRDQYRKEKNLEELRIPGYFDSDTSIKDYAIELLEKNVLIDKIIAKNTKPKARGRKRKQDIVEPNQSNTLESNSGKADRGGKRGRGYKSKINRGTGNLLNSTFEKQPKISPSRLVKASRGRKKSRGGKNTVRNSTRDALNSTIESLGDISTVDDQFYESMLNGSTYNMAMSVEGLTGITRGVGTRSRCGKRGRKSTNIIPVVDKSNNARGTYPRVRNSARHGNTRSIAPHTTTSCSSNIYPTYNIGNTDDYPDQSAEVELFSTKPTNETNDIIVLDDEVYEDNEELSVKVTWQGFDIYKFTIREHEKLSKIFEMFTKKENVSSDKLLFMYNDKVVTANDTPASIGYSIAKFINGELKHNASSFIDTTDSGPKIKIKFQCQQTKKPFSVSISKKDKLLLAMSKCAEHLSLMLNQLKFSFDGDAVFGTSTPQDLDLESGDCIDVIILS